MSKSYSFGAGGFKLGDRVEVLTTGQRGILISEIVHLTGCNTYFVLLPNVTSVYSDRAAEKHYDHLILRKLKPNEAVFTNGDNLTDETVYAPKGTDVNAVWLKESAKAGKEPIPEVDEAVGAEEIIYVPGTEVWHKVYNKPMLVSYIYRNIYEKELRYGLTYMADNKEVCLSSHRYALIPMQIRIKIYDAEDRKSGSLFSDSPVEIGYGITIDDFGRFTLEP